jgi:hypothetical protein
VRNEVQLLVNDGDARGLRLRGGLELHRLILVVDRAFVRAVLSADDLHQRRFACAVFAADGMHLAVTQIEVDAVERDHARKALADAFQPQDLAQRRLLRRGRAGRLDAGTCHSRLHGCSV